VFSSLFFSNGSGSVLLEQVYFAEIQRTQMIVVVILQRIPLLAIDQFEIEMIH
jgi:hypothetical protein